MTGHTTIQHLIGILAGTFSAILLGLRLTAYGQTIERLTGWTLLGNERRIQVLEVNPGDSSTSPDSPVNFFVGLTASVIGLLTGLFVYFTGSFVSIASIFVKTLYTGTGTPLQVETLYLIAGFGVITTLFMQRQAMLYLESIGTCPNW